MAAGSRIAEAYVAINADFTQLSKSLEGLKSSVATSLGAIESQFRKIRTIAEVALGGLSLGMMIKSADDLSKAYSFAGLIFGQFASTVIDESDRLSKKFGLSRRELVQGAAEIGDVFRKIGAGPELAANLSAGLERVVAAVALRRNVGMSEALQFVEYGIEGGGRGLRELGVHLTEAQVELEAMRMGLVRVNGAFNESQLAIARASLLVRAFGEVSRVTEGGQLSLSTKMNAAWSKIRRSFEDIGMSLLPFAHKFADVFNGIAETITEWVEKHKADMDYFVNYTIWAIGQAVASVKDFGSKFANVFDGIGAKFTWIRGVASAVFETIGVIWRNWSLIVERTGILVSAKIMDLGNVFNWLKDVVGVFLNWFSTNWKSIFIDAFNVVLTALKNLGKNFMDFGESAYNWIASGFTKPFEFKMTALGAGAELTTPKPEFPGFPEMTDITDQLAAVDEKMVAVEQKRLDEAKKPVVEKEKKKPEAIAYPPPLQRPVGAEFTGLVDFAKKIQLSAFGSSGDYMRLTSQWTERTAIAAEKLAARANPPAVAVGPN